MWLGIAASGKARREVYVAKKDGVKVAEAPTMRELAQRLKVAHTDPRDVLIESVPPPPPTVRMGLTTRDEPRMWNFIGLSRSTSRSSQMSYSEQSMPPSLASQRPLALAFRVSCWSLTVFSSGSWP